ncbi:MAG: leucine-rich repeat domain-containing protein [Oscillospiraceae bacterium]|nr:MAG: leucine-rich repeat domain-containing protein [Oscillospiraceae bacterium]
MDLVILDTPNGSSDNGYTNSPFYGCTSLKNIVLPERLTVIGRLAFGGLVSGRYGEKYIPPFESISLPSTLKEIHEMAFLNARNLKNRNLRLRHDTVGCLRRQGIRYRKSRHSTTALP